MPRADDVRGALYLNGKFTAQRTTGVQRVASALVQALDRRADADRWTLLCPPQGEPPPLRRIAVHRIGPARWPLHAWEQCVLPWHARDGWLVDLAGAAPALAARQLALVHDAAVFDQPQAYAPAFARWYRWLFRRLAARGDALLTVSCFSRERLAVALRVPPARLGLLPLGADHLAGVAPDDRLLRAAGLLERPFVLAVGSANPTKNLDALVHAWALLGDDAPSLVLAGGHNARVFQGGAPAADAQGVIRLGAVGDGVLAALYLHAAFLVFPSLYEGFGLPPLEAMGFGCPVLATRCASIPEVCGDAAAYIDGSDAPAIAAGVRRLLGDPALRARLRAGGPAHARARTWAQAAQVLEEALEAAVEAAARARAP